MLVLREGRPLQPGEVSEGFWNVFSLRVLDCSQLLLDTKGGTEGKPSFSATDLWHFGVFLRPQQLSYCTETTA